MKVVVVGGGISGLVAAHELVKAGHEVRCLEPSGRPGGAIRTEVREGFVCEAGPHAILDGATETRALVEELGLERELVRPSPAARRRFVYVDGRLRTVPTDPFSLVTSDILSAAGKWRLCREPFVKAREAPAADLEEETVYEFGARRLGDEAARKLVAPATIGVFAGDARRLVVREAFPRLAQLEDRHGSLLKGLRALRREGGSLGRSFSFREGLEALPRALAQRLGEGIVRGVARALRRDGARFQLDVEGAAGTATIHADRVVLACPPPIAARLLAPLLPAATAALEGIPLAPAAIASLGFRSTDLGMDTSAYGLIVARGERATMLGCQYESTVFPGRAPEGATLIRVILGGVFDPGVVGESDEAIRARVLEELRLVTGLARDPELFAVWRVPHGIPQYERGHARRVEAIEGALAGVPGLSLIGWTLRGVSVNEGIRNATTFARGIQRAGTEPPG